jgi:ergothioneine biosynthesis protein EgtB
VLTQSRTKKLLPAMHDSTSCSDRYRSIRATTQRLAAPLSAEDQNLQPMPEASPVKWHLAHTTWFFETFVLAPLPGYTLFDFTYQYLFNSYYEAVGPRHPRPARGLLSRPSANTVRAYRQHVDEALLARPDVWTTHADVLELGLQHEQQHQELILTDLKHAFAQNPLFPAYHAPPTESTVRVPPLGWRDVPTGVQAIGHATMGFAFDNELPRHRVFLEPAQVADRPISNGEYLRFIADGGYARPGYWLSDGWHARTQHQWEAPLYWLRNAERGPADTADGWDVFTLHGAVPLNPTEPVCHVSYYEADAFARWSQARLPTEFEWEACAAGTPIAGNLLESGRLHPAPLTGPGWLGDVWQWTGSAYLPYPGYVPAAGALGEYNGKFMVNQQVLRGGSCATPASHVRCSYRNFFPPEARWQFTGIRLARSV